MVQARSYSLSAEGVAAAVADAIPYCACNLRPDMLSALEDALDREQDPRGRQVLQQLLENACIASQDQVPLCQDTGTVRVILEVGPEVAVPAGIFSQVDAAVSQAFADTHLRMSTLRDALFDRSNPGTNTPAFCEVDFGRRLGARLHVMLKGGGSDNASRVCMLAPGAGMEGVQQVVLEAVREKASSACPPLVIGVGVGTTFDEVAKLAKRALFRSIGSPTASDQAAAFEAEMLEKVNALGLGPGALGGSCTALAVHLETAPCHIAALPVAVNLGCCAMRSLDMELEVEA